mmetsp:Transcript_22211/g.33051  ORF Transcript_22211/g.33051 Transcript_22211/m.33051 type:complete len:358 (-) Transcript_22211:39-1112(-)
MLFFNYIKQFQKTTFYYQQRLPCTSSLRLFSIDPDELSPQALSKLREQFIDKLNKSKQPLSIEEVYKENQSIDNEQQGEWYERDNLDRALANKERMEKKDFSLHELEQDADDELLGEGDDDDDNNKHEQKWKKQEEEKIVFDLDKEIRAQRKPSMETSFDRYGADLKVNGVNVPYRYRSLFLPQDDDNKKSPAASRQKEERYRRKALRLAKRHNSAKSWRRDEEDFPFTRRQMRVGKMVGDALLQLASGVRSIQASIAFGTVEMSVSLRKAKVHWNCLDPTPENVEKAQKELEEAKPDLRAALASSVSLKYVPELVFIYDDGTVQGKTARLIQVIHQVEKRRAIEKLSDQVRGEKKK